MKNLLTIPPHDTYWPVKAVNERYEEDGIGIVIPNTLQAAPGQAYIAYIPCPGTRYSRALVLNAVSYKDAVSQVRAALPHIAEDAAVVVSKALAHNVRTDRYKHRP